MKASKLIDLLHNIVDASGDAEIVLYDDELDDTVPLGVIGVNTTNKTILLG